MASQAHAMVLQNVMMQQTTGILQQRTSQRFAEPGRYWEGSHKHVLHNACPSDIEGNTLGLQSELGAECPSDCKPRKHPVLMLQAGACQGQRQQVVAMPVSHEPAHGTDAFPAVLLQDHEP